MRDIFQIITHSYASSAECGPPAGTQELPQAFKIEGSQLLSLFERAPTFFIVLVDDRAM